MASICIEKCEACGETATMMCARCNTLYCSIKCQRGDWANHRHFCPPLPSALSELRDRKQALWEIAVNKTTCSTEPAEDSNINQPQTIGKCEEETPLMDPAEDSNINQPQTIGKCEEETPLMDPPFKFRRFQEKRNPFKAIIVDTSTLHLGNVGCLPMKQKSTFMAMHEKIASLHLSDKPYTPRTNEFCLAKLKGSWFRAKAYKKLDKAHFLVWYIDLTNYGTASVADIRPYPLEIRDDCHTTFCAIEGLPKIISYQLRNALREEMKVGTVITIDEVKRDDRKIIIQCDELKERLREFLR